MNPDEPTHFTTLVIGTGLVESILAAALSKAGYSVLQLDNNPYYGDQWASLSLQELADHAHSSSSSAPPAELLSLSSRFNLSVQPALLRATGPGIDLLVRSRVATYLSFGLLRGIALWRAAAEGGEGAGAGSFELVPGTKADVFNHKSLGLVEKRRLTKFLLWVAGKDALGENQLLQANGSLTFVELVQKGFSISESTAQSLAYALALSSSSQDLALPALERLRSIIHSTGRYGPSPFLVGHYGGAGDLIGGFSRICAVWGGGQILGRPILALDRSPTPGKVVVATPLPFSASAPAPSAPPPAVAAPTSDSAAEACRPLGVPLQLDPDGEPTTFTADWVIAASSHLDTLFPSTATTSHKSQPPHTARAIVILDKRVPFPSRAGAAQSKATEEGGEAADDDEDEKNAPDSSLYVFPPQASSSSLGTVTAFQVGSGTFACPEAYTVLYLSAPVLSPPPADATAKSLLAPYLDILLAQAATTALYSTFHFLRSAPSPPAGLPANLIVVPELKESQGTTAGLVTSLDEAVAVAEKLFWTVVGEGAKEEGVQFFAKEAVTDDDE